MTTKEIETALQAIGYSPIDALDEAAGRIAAQPAVVEALAAYMEAGSPPMAVAAGKVTALAEKLPGRYGLTIARLSTALGLDPSGCFLLAAELYKDPASGDELITTMLEEGYWREISPGLRAHSWPPASQSLPVCTYCALRWANRYKKCPRCGHGVTETASDGNPHLAVPPDHAEWS